MATTVFSNKPTGIITASAHGQKGHEELQLIMRTLIAKLSPETNLLIPGIKGKANLEGEIILQQVADDLLKFCNAFEVLLVKVEE